MTLRIVDRKHSLEAKSLQPRSLQPRPGAALWPILPAVLLTLLSAAATAAPINRCETTDGRVVYSDEPCPSGTKHSRLVDDKPPVEVIHSREDTAKDARSAGSLRRAPAEAPIQGDLGRDREAASDIRKIHLAECDDLVRRVEYAQRDLSAAAEGERASAELSLRRLQAEYEGKCSTKPH